MYLSARCSFYLACIACLAAVCMAYSPGLAPYAARIPIDVVKRDETGEAQAQALTNTASAAASAAKISTAYWEALDLYGRQSGVPLLVRSYGPLDNLYGASLPTRSFVGRIDPSFQRNAYNNIEHRTASGVGSIVI